MLDVLQVLFLIAIVVAVYALTDWRWALLGVGVFGFAASVQWERSHRRGS